MRRGSGLIGNIDWVTVLLYLTIVICGWFVLYSVEYRPDTSTAFSWDTYYGKQITWSLIAFATGVLLLILDSRIYTAFPYMFYAASLLSLIGVLLFGITVAGSKSWFEFGSIRIQPGEFAKFTTALAFAKYLSGQSVKLTEIKHQIIALAIIGAPALLILLQGDAGSALVYASFLMVMYREGLPAVYFVVLFTVVLLSILALVVNPLYITAGLLIAGSFIFYISKKSWRTGFAIAFFVLMSAGYVFSVDHIFNEVLKPHQRERIEVLLGKNTDPRGAAYNLNQAKIAIGSGGLWGKGYLKGTQTQYDFVPEQSTDFIFTNIGEEHGFIGSVAIIGLFMVLLFRLIILAERQRSKFSRVYGYAVVAILFFHLAINIGMTIGLAPVIGIPFPFISYGGSSVLAFTMLIFIFLKLDAERLAVFR